MAHRILLPVLFGVLVSASGWSHADDGRHPEPRRYKHKEEFWDGECKVKREWKKNGEYREQRKCKGEEHARRPVHVFPAAQAVYPPWIVGEQGERAYDPRQQPRTVSTAARCNSDTVGQVLGGLLGGALGSQVGKGSGRTVAIVGGAVAGVLVGGELGKRMDASSQGCVGQVLEVAPADRGVQWAEGPAQYVVVPGQVVQREGSYCRPYTVEIAMDGQRERSRGMACRRDDGTWVAA